MREIILLRFDAPLMSFGGPAVDNRGIIQDHPPLSLLTGLIANALGLQHREADRLHALQRRLRYAARCDRPGVLLADFQTVDLSQSSMVNTGWTTRGAMQRRSGGTAREGTHIRLRDYLADAIFTVALTLDPAEESPTVDDVARALAEPERPLFIGRKSCLPATPILLGRLQAPSLLSALRTTPRAERAAPREGPLAAWWPAGAEESTDSTIIPVADERDWRNQIHGGRRLVCHGVIALEEVLHGAE